MGAVFFVLVTSADQRRVVRRGELLGLALGIASFVIALAVAPPATFGAHATGALAGRRLARRLGLGARSPAALLVVAPPPREETTEVPAITDSPTAYVPQRAWTHGPQPEAEAAALDRRHLLLIRVGGAVATFVVLGAEVGDILTAPGRG